MDRTDLERYREWFTGYAESFYSDDYEERRHAALKIKHTFNVCEAASAVADGEAVGAGTKLLAGAAALFHDVGRFSQYAQYRTFRDAISINHGKLGADILRSERVLAGLPENEQEIIINAVRFHNAFAIPALQSEEQTLVLKLVRDADKLDIWPIFLGLFEGPEEDRIPEAGLGLPELPFYSEEAVQSIRRGEIVANASLKTINDFRLLQLSWAYDLNFNTSVRLMLEGNYIDRLVAQLPKDDEIAGVTRIIKKYACDRLSAAAAVA